jgi:hypothetical protein
MAVDMAVEEEHLMGTIFQVVVAALVGTQALEALELVQVVTPAAADQAAEEPGELHILILLPIMAPVVVVELG